MPGEFYLLRGESWTCDRDKLLNTLGWEVDTFCMMCMVRMFRYIPSIFLLIFNEFSVFGINDA